MAQKVNRWRRSWTQMIVPVKEWGGTILGVPWFLAFALLQSLCLANVTCVWRKEQYDALKPFSICKNTKMKYG